MREFKYDKTRGFSYNEIVDQFTEQFTRDDVLDVTQEYLDTLGASPLAFDNVEGGVVACGILHLLNAANITSMERMVSPSDIKLLCCALMEHYGFTSETVPAKQMLRELMRLELHREALINKIVQSEGGEHGSRKVLEGWLKAGVGTFQKQSDVLISDEQVEELTASMKDPGHVNFSLGS